MDLDVVYFFGISGGPGNSTVETPLTMSNSNWKRKLVYMGGRNKVRFSPPIYECRSEI
jgi:hypothetical protein